MSIDCMRTITQDLVFGARLLMSRPGFAAIVVLVLTLGIGANSAIFSVAHAVLLRPLPYAEPERLYQLDEINPRGEAAGVSPADAEAFRRHTPGFERIGQSHWENATLTGPEGAENLYGARVSAELFGALGVRPAIGRSFRPEEFEPGAPGVVILSDRLWRRRFGAGSGIVGRELMLNGQAFTIAGVMGADFHHDNRFEYWIPWRMTAADTAGRENRTATVVRLRRGTSPEVARAEAEAVLRNAAEADFAKGWRIRLTRLHEQVTARSRPMLLTLLAAAGFVLLLACLNVANLLIARGADRIREMAIRAALGAGRGRAIRQMLTESLLLALSGGVCGLAVGWMGSRLLTGFFAENSPLPRLEQTRIDAPVLGFTFALTLITGVLFGLFPAVQAARIDLQGALRSGARGGGGGRRLPMVRDGLIVAQTAFSVVLLAGAGLMLRSFNRLMSTDAGIRPEGVLTLRVPVPVGIKERPRQIAHYARLVEEARGLPGLTAAGVIAPLPLAGVDVNATFSAEGRAVKPGERELVKLRTASPGYFAAMGLGLVRGRLFQDSDGMDAHPVAIVNETLARKYFAGRDAIGRRVSMSSVGEGPWMTVVGVVRDVKPVSLSDAPAPELYRPAGQYIFSPFATTLVVRAARGDLPALAAAVQRRIRSMNPEQPVHDVLPMEQVIARSAAQSRFRTVLLGLFAALAAALAGTGLYGVLSYTVSQRVREIGVRVALGASRGRIAGAVAGHAVKVVSAGIGLGLAGAHLLTQLIAAQLYQVEATDPPTYAGVCALLALIGAVAAWAPAWRALQVEPATALRCE